MKITLPLPANGQVHTYCVRCQQGVPTYDLAAKRYTCGVCGAIECRALIIDPAVEWWIDDTGEYWHEATGVFACYGGKFLFFERTRFPFGLTVAAGHRDRGEAPIATGRRELREETGIVAVNLLHVATQDIWGDQCRRGADVHRWHCYAVQLQAQPAVKVDASEGIKPVWLTLDEALAGNLTFATRYVITRNLDALRAVAA